MFYTASNIKLYGVRNVIDEDIESELKWTEKCGLRIDEWLANDKKTNKLEQYNLADFTDIWALPNFKVPSDHTPIGALFEFDYICSTHNGHNRQNMQCRCCLEPVVKKKLSKKERREERMKRQREKMQKV